MDDAALLQAFASGGGRDSLCHALREVAQRAARGEDVELYFDLIAEACLKQCEDLVVRALAYRTLPCCRTPKKRESSWESVVEAIVADLKGANTKSDNVESAVEVIAAALRLVENFGVDELSDLLAKTRQELDETVRHRDARVRCIGIDVLGSLLVRHSWVFETEIVVPWKDRWKIIINHLFDIDDSISHQCFCVINNLFQRGEDAAREGVTPADPLSSVIRAELHVAEELGNVSERVLARFSLLIPPFKADGLHVIERVIRDVGKKSGKAFVVAEVHRRLLPLLSSTDMRLLFETGQCVLRLMRIAGEQPSWVVTVCLSFLHAMSSTFDGSNLDSMSISGTSSVSESATTLLVELMARHVHMVSDQFRVPILLDILAVAARVRDISRRVRVLKLIFTDVVKSTIAMGLALWEKRTDDEMTTAEFLADTDLLRLIESDACRSILDEAGEYREEVLSVAVTATMEQCGRALPPSDRPLHHVCTAIALEVIDHFSACLSWDTQGRTVAHTSFLRLIARMCHIYENERTRDPYLPAGRMQLSLSIMLAEFDRIVSETARLRSLWILSQNLHLDNDTARENGKMLLSWLRGRLLSVSAREQRKQELVQAAKQGILGGSSSGRNSTQRYSEGREIVLQCLLHLGIRHEMLSGDVVSLLREFLDSPDCDMLVKDRVSVIIRVIQAVIANDPLDFATLFRPSPDGRLFEGEHIDARSMSTDDSVLLEALESLVDDDSFFVPSSDPSLRPVVVTGSSDPVHIDIYHEPDSSSRIIRLYARIINTSKFDMNNVVLRASVGGMLFFPDGRSHAQKEIRELPMESTATWRVDFTVGGFERNFVHLEVLFGREGESAETATETENEELSSDLNATNTGGGAKIRIAPYLLPSPISLSCERYTLSPNDFLSPRTCSMKEFLAEWNRLYCGFHATFSLENAGDSVASAASLLHMRSDFERKPFHRVFEKMYNDNKFFQIAFASSTWFGDNIFFVACGSKGAHFEASNDDDTEGLLISSAAPDRISRSLHVDDEWSVRVELRASSSRVLSVIHSQFQDWFNQLTEGNLRLTAEIPQLSSMKM